MHHCWTDQASQRSFDIYLCPYAPLPFGSDPADSVVIGETIPGLKWTGLNILLNTWQGWRDYDYIAFVDDDILASQTDWSKFFEICADARIKIAQPSLTQDSYFSHLMTLQNKNFILRETTYVEAMMPCFHRDTLVDLLPTLPLNSSGSGWGLDYLWAMKLGYRDMWIVDSVPMRHTRPVGLAYNSRMNEFIAETRALVRAQGASGVMRSLNGVTLKGEKLSLKDPDFMRLYLAGYWDQVKDHSVLFWRVLRHQLDQ